MRNFYVYFHYRLDTNRVFYIGKGADDRAFVKSGRNQYWNRIAKKAGFRVEIVQYGIEEQEAFELERDMISLYGKMGYTLANLTAGGKGGSSWTEELKQRVSLLKTGKPRSPLTAAHRANISRSLKGRTKGIPRRPRTAETKQKIANGHRGKKRKPFTDTHKQNMSVSCSIAAKKWWTERNPGNS